jgi:hypothetical protein
MNIDNPDNQFLILALLWGTASLFLFVRSWIKGEK